MTEKLDIKPGIYKAGENHYYFLSGETHNGSFFAEDYSGLDQLLSPEKVSALEPIFTTENQYYVENFDNPNVWAEQMRKRGQWLESKVKDVQTAIEHQMSKPKDILFSGPIRNHNPDLYPETKNPTKKNIFGPDQH